MLVCLRVDCGKLGGFLVETRGCVFGLVTLIDKVARRGHQGCGVVCFA